ncbi:SDR family NAD(P)-dependent oxidoreductase [Streptomyces sp. NEAU-YJ-81]|uniref:SDR family NAD(P)-dependent oxidoreductase n=1 Tax=Streptomyces sp. NEAU-YJ-81 TaxID=2820288 RepID=UPI001ABCDA0C|nr:SDR family oxidoreductase [Streptomyces sp. NEAU-YJ-81]MBO3682246.1 SDR family oxidoreductase [Streptomyces sp. NEAU-YJ-81]
MRDLFDLHDHVAVLSGGHGAIAEAMAGALAARGCHLVLGARRVDRCEELARRLTREHGVTALAHSLDVSDEKSVQSFVTAALGVTGRIDVAINSAATFWAAPPEEVPIERGWRRVIDVNLTGAFLLAQAAGRVMLTQGCGSIINVSSFGGLTTLLPRDGSTISYTTSKGAMISLTRDLAAQWAHKGVRVNALAPGFIATGMADTIEKERIERLTADIPMGRFGRPEELAGAVVFLASAASSYVTGAVLSADGGRAIV